MINNFIISLILTISIETCVLYILVKKWYAYTDISSQKILIGSCFASLMTLPYVHFVFPELTTGMMYIIAAELFAVIIEQIFYRYFFEITRNHALLLSLGANLVSFLIGIILFW